MSSRFENVQCKSIEDVLEHAQNKGVVLPKKQIEFMKEGLENERVSASYLAKMVDDIAKKRDEIGLKWQDKEIDGKEEKQGKIVATYKDSTNKVHVFIKEMTVEKSKDPVKIGTKFYVPVRIDPTPEGDKFVNMGTSNSLDGAKNGVSAYFTSIILSEIKNSKEVPNKTNDNKVKEREPVEMNM